MKDVWGRRKISPFMIIVSVLLILVVMGAVMMFLKEHESPQLTGKWLSEETGECVTFTADGKVKFEDNTPYGIYRIISPTEMEYTIDGHQFKMQYKIENRKLFWGTDASKLECFKRK